jgi:hypothetical protein
LHLQHQFEQEVNVLNPTTIPGELDQVEQQTEQLEWAKRFQQPQRTMYCVGYGGIHARPKGPIKHPTG